MNTLNRFPYYHGTHLTEDQLRVALLLASMVLNRMSEGDNIWEDWFAEATEAIEHVTNNPYIFAQGLRETIRDTFEERLRIEVDLPAEQFAPLWGKASCARVEVSDDTAVAIYFKFYDGQPPYQAVHRDNMLEWLSEVEDEELGSERCAIKNQIERNPEIEYWLFHNG